MTPEIKSEIDKLIEESLREAAERKLLPALSPPPFQLESPREKEHGDLAANIAMKLASSAKRPPAKIAEILALLLEPRIEKTELIDRVEADPRKGFLNFFLSPSALQRTLKQILASPGRWGETDPGAGKKVLLEFVSANPTGPLTVAHGRQAAVGDVLANTLAKAGFKVCREYYLNDRGRQMDILGSSVYARRRELMGEKVDFPEDYYQGEYIKRLARDIPDKELEGLSPEEAVACCSNYAGGKLLEQIKEELADFGVGMDNWVSEKELVDSGKVKEGLEKLEVAGATYEKEGALWFRSTAHGDEKDRVLRKSNGDLTYLSSDIAYHREKYGRGYARLFDFWGPDHHGYIARLKGAMAALGLDPEILEVVIVQLSTLYEGKKQLSMSTRMGEFISLRQVLDAVGRDAARYFFVRRRKESHLDFDLDLARKQTPDNPVYYVQYAHARISSIFKKYEERSGSSSPEPLEADFTLLVDPAEMEVIKKLLDFPRLLETAALSRQIHLIPTYLEDLSALYHRYYSHCRVISNNEEMTRARLALARAVQMVLAEGLAVLGVSAPESM